MNPRPFLRLPLALAALAVQQGCAHAGAHSRLGEAHEVTSQMAEALVRHHAYDSAIPLLREALKGDPNNAALRRSLGVVLSDRGLYDQAQSELYTAHRLNPADAEVASALGVLFDQQGMAEPAESWHRRAIAQSPSRAEFHNNLGFCLYLQGRDEAALAAYNEALRQDPAATRAHNNRGFALARLGRHNEALRSFQQGGTKAQALVNLGMSHALAGDSAAARVAYLDALRLDSSLKAAEQNLAALDAQTAAPARAPKETL